MTETESPKFTNEEILDMKMKDLVHRIKHINFQKKKKEKMMETYIYWKKKYNKRGRSCHKREDIITRFDREEKYKDNNEKEYFIFIKEIKVQNKK